LGEKEQLKLIRVALEAEEDEKLVGDVKREYGSRGNAKNQVYISVA